MATVPPFDPRHSAIEQRDPGRRPRTTSLATSRSARVEDRPPGPSCTIGTPDFCTILIKGTGQTRASIPERRNCTRDPVHREHRADRHYANSTALSNRKSSPAAARGCKAKAVPQKEMPWISRKRPHRSCGVRSNFLWSGKTLVDPRPVRWIVSSVSCGGELAASSRVLLAVPRLICEMPRAG